MVELWRLLEKETESQKGPGKTGKGPMCKFFGTEDGCKKGQDCTYTYTLDWAALGKEMLDLQFNQALRKGLHCQGHQHEWRST